MTDGTTIACCYHLSKPKYNVDVFVDVLTRDIDTIHTKQRDAIIITVAGDFNQLNTD